MRVEDHRLIGDDVVYRESPNHSGPLPQPADTLVLHFTAGANAESAVRILSDPARQVSAHLVVARDGGVIQLLPLNYLAWHAGRSCWHDREEFNRFSISIEIENAGRLTERDGRLFSWFECEYPSKEAVRAVHRNESELAYWHCYPQCQLDVVEELTRMLVAAYHLRYIHGHEEIAPDRKNDPGPAFPLDDLRTRLLP
ncbi:MAG: N-acetylmuramoyl-L-alanine amidase [Candidatus Latescibacterota bacterium]|nr:N-acetylmuramoyl-L-alanine amidase [Candidatus Latescibacterota bacterium]